MGILMFENTCDKISPCPWYPSLRGRISKTIVSTHGESLSLAVVVVVVVVVVCG